MNTDILDQILATAARMAGVIDMGQFDTELAAMQAMRDGEIPSPQRFGNLLLISLRITGTGVSYRAQRDEFVHRSPDLYLNDEFLQRCNGLPVTWEHPEKAVLNSEEFANRVIGMIAMPFIKGDEVWGIAKIYDSSAANLLETERLSTSPTVVLKSGDAGGTKFQTGDGSTILIEGKPYLLDAVAICSLGVWDKSGPPSGVDNDSISRGDSMSTTIESLQRQVAELERRYGTPLCQELRSEFVAAQSRADSAMRAIGDTSGAPSFVAGERLLEYKARLLKPMQMYSKFKNADLNKIGDAGAFAAVENEIYADYQREGLNPTGFRPGEIRSVITRDASGRPITRYIGDTNACWDMFNPPVRYVQRFLVPR